MKKLLSILVMLGVACSVCAQTSPGTPTTGPGNNAGLLYASNFGLWSVPQGNTGQYSWSSASFCTATASNIPLNPVFATNAPIYIKDQVPANSELVTPSAVTVGTSGCSITVSPVHPHLTYTLQSGTCGLQEAINYAHGLVYQILVTPDWARAGCVTSNIIGAKGNFNVTIIDERTSVYVPYIWNGFIYVAQTFGSSLTLEHGGVSLPDQNLLNFVDTPASLVGGGLDPGNQAVRFKNDAVGGLAAETLASSLATLIVPPIAGQYVVLYPNSSTPAGSESCTVSMASAGYGIDIGASPFSGQVVRLNSGSLPGCPRFITNTMSGATLPSYITPTSVTSIYGGFNAGISCANNSINGCGSLNLVVNSTNLAIAVQSYPPQTFTTLLASGGAAQTYDYAATSWTAQSDSTVNGSPAPQWGGGVLNYTPFLIVYYTGTPPPPSTAITVLPCLQLANNQLSLPVPCDAGVDTGTSTAYSIKIAAVTQLIPGIEVKWTPLNTNTSTAPTLSVNGITATVTSKTGSTIALGDISGGLTPHEADAIYDPDGTWHLQNGLISGGSSGITNLTGDGTATGPGSAPFTLATVNASPGTCGDSTHICQITTIGKGLITGQTQISISTGSGTVSGQANNVIGKGCSATSICAQSGISDDGTTILLSEIACFGSCPSTGMTIAPLGTPTNWPFDSTSPATALSSVLTGSTTGSGNVVLATSPTLVTPALGTPSAEVITNVTGTCTACTANNSVKIGGITVAGTPSIGQVPIATSTSAATWQTPASASALVLISSQILGSPAATFTFSSIPATPYTNLELKCEGRGSNASANIGVSIQFNGDTAADYDLGTLQASNSSVTSSSAFGGASVNVGNMPGSTATANYSGGFNASIHYYANTTFFKHVLTDASFMSSTTGTAYFIQKFDNWWRSTSAINSLTVNASAGNFVTGSVCNLYGVL